MEQMVKRERKKSVNKSAYDKIKSIDGSHPFKKSCPDCYVDYPARKRAGGKVTFFNFELAKEMGLIDSNHPEVMTAELEKVFLDTFSIVIINEYDQIHNTKFQEKDLLPNTYMATRYLQLQHPNKQGKTSGDGRSIWNGVISNNSKTWDISSCGTGATCLSPATHLQNKFFKTGDPSVSYGCGYSEIDEGLATLFFSEILHKNSVKTERVLGIIEYSKGIAINIRAHENLIRPSHMFGHLRQGNLKSLKNVLDYCIDREVRNKRVKRKTGLNKYRFFLDRMVEVFAELAAQLEDEYIFCWMDWDGDNILTDGSLIDYGSIRQFGLFHHEYRYDDTDRYSTSITEQKNKARSTVQTFAQLVDFVMSGKRKPIKNFANSPCLKRFDKLFEEEKDKNLLEKIGFSTGDVGFLMREHRQIIKKLRKTFSYFERTKSKEGLVEVADGINWNAVFCMRDILRELPQFYLARGTSLRPDEFIEVIRSNYATEEDVFLSSYRRKKISDFQKFYWSLITKTASHHKVSSENVLLKITMRSSVINKYDRITGDSITKIVDRVLKASKEMSPDKLFSLLQEFINYQNLDPDNEINFDRDNKSIMVKGMLKLVREYREGL